MSKPEQLSLFSAKEGAGTYQPVAKPLLIGAATLQDWKQRIYEYQCQVKTAPVLQQVDLLGQPVPISIAERLDPFSLRQQNIEFWRWKNPDPGVPAFYFVIDYAVPLLLYVGETVKSGQRWKGEHGCKWYLDHYCSAHSVNKMKTAVGIAFWLEAPSATRPRQQLELELIQKWRSPFNKENWQIWGTPFVTPKPG
ncbi:GIY-YIG nuclease family protein [Cyanobacteria bacterium FACHB-502]|nr:GIY-YIG nuclease family protein [Cyanobacteria bacterium FACHB-502]